MTYARGTLVLAVVLLAACSAAPGATALGTSLGLQTAPRSGGCETAAGMPVEVTHDRTTLTFLAVATGVHPQLVWPAGFTAWLVDGKAVLLDGQGRVIGREGGAAVTDIGGGLGPGDLFYVCAVGGRTY
jgi:hypothetical protein